MEKVKVAVVTLGDSRREFFKKRESIVQEELEKVQAAFGERYDLFFPPIVFSAAEGMAVQDAIHARGITAVILHLPVWATPSLCLRPAFSTQAPVLLLGNKQRNTSSLVTLLAVAGMLEQTGKSCIRVAGDFFAPEVQQQVDTYVQACALAEGIRRSSFGMIGGRSIGIGTTVADPSQWQKVFGTEFDHCDQYEIVYRAQDLPAQRVQKHLDWVKSHFGIGFGENFDEAHLEKQVRSYLALKDLAAEKGYDFMGVKCQQEMSDHFVLQCLGVGLLNNSYDADGFKTPIPTSCECDCDGALTMQLLHLVSQGKPSCLMDIKFFDDQAQEVIVANCGAAAPYLANPQDPEEAMKHVTLLPHIFGLAGGGAMQFITQPGEVTVARLFRRDGEYVLSCFEGKTEMRDLEELKKTTWCYPHAFVRADIDYECFFRTMNSNHLHLVFGRYAKILELFCKIVGIRFLCYNR